MRIDLPGFDQFADRLKARRARLGVRSRHADAVTLGLVGWKRDHRDHDTVLAQRLERALERVAADRVQHDIHLLRAVLERLAGVVDEHVGPEAAHEVLVARRSDRRHVRAAGLGELHGKRPDAAGTAGDQQALAGDESRLVEQRLPRGGPGQRQRRGVHDVQRGRGAHQVGRLGDGIFGERTAVDHAEDELAALELPDVVAERLDRADQFAAQRDGQGHAEPFAGAATDLPVDRVHARRVDLDEHLADARLRPIDVLDAHHVVGTVLADDDRFHVWKSRCLTDGSMMATVSERPQPAFIRNS